MQADNRIRFFLGANSAQGFYSLYDHFIDPKQANAIYILKGGPGCGKSTLMRRIGTRAEELGEQVEYIHCSGDPESLDGILLPSAKIAIADGTAPHVIEPPYPGVVGSYVNLGACYRMDDLSSIKSEIVNCMTGYQDYYKKAYRCLHAAEQIMEDVRSCLTNSSLQEKIIKRAHGILTRETRNPGHGTGRITPRFLGAVTHKGRLTFYSTTEVLCKRIYILDDSSGLSHLMLTELLSGLTQSGYDVIACPSPIAPDRLEHLIIPERSLAFLTSTHDQPYPKRPYRTIRIDAMVDPELIRRNKARLRFSRKVSAALIDEAIESLNQAKVMHDNLEALYNPHVDFDQVGRIADELSVSILKR